MSIRMATSQGDILMMALIIWRDKEAQSMAHGKEIMLA
jgi:hypothetical protein